MSDGPVEPPRLSIEVRRPREHASTAWTARIASWWAADHTMSGPGTRVVSHSSTRTWG